MLRHYYAQRRRGGVNPLGVGVVAIGSIYRLNHDFTCDDETPSDKRRTSWIVEGFLNGQCHAARRDRATGRWISLFISGRSDMAVIRSLRTGRRRSVPIRVLQQHDDHGLWRDPTAYPSLPDLRLYRRR